MQGALKKSSLADAGKMAMLPASRSVPTKTSSVLSAQGLVISAQSVQKEAAWKWMQFFTSQLVQRAFVSEMPIWSSVQTSPDVTQLDPQMLVKRDQLLNAMLRPNIPDYAEFSAVLQKALHQALSGSMEPAEALQWAKAGIVQMPAK